MSCCAAAMCRIGLSVLGWTCGEQSLIDKDESFDPLWWIIELWLSSHVDPPSHLYHSRVRIIYKASLTSLNIDRWVIHALKKHSVF